MPRLSWNEIQVRAVDRRSRKKPFASDRERLELLFERYRELTETAR